MKVYQYSKKQIYTKFYIAFAIMLFSFLLSLFKVAVLGDKINWLHICFLVCVPVIFFKEFIALHHPTQVTIDQSGVRFEFFKFSHYYQWNEIKSVLVKGPGRGLNDTIRIFINEPKLLKGKYWLSANGMDNYKEIITVLKNKNKVAT